MRSALPSIILACGLLSACGPSATEGGFDSANPAARMYAIEDAARQGDQAAVGELIEQLDSDDPAVRLLAIGALERLTGQTYGFRHYDSQMQRHESIARWLEAYESGSIQPMISKPPPTLPAPAAPLGSTAPAAPHG